MGEDRTTCTEKKSNEVIPCRRRHSSVISSCSEDAESESSSAGYPPTPDEDRDEELEYGPGIVNKLRTRFLSITLKQNRGMSIRRSCSMEDLLDQDRPCRSDLFSNQKISHQESGDSKNWGILKRAKSMDTLLMDMQQQEAPIMNGDVKKEPKIIRRKDGGLNRSTIIITDEELPKPDTVKTYKRMFEPAESRRGSHSRRPPVLRASAKSVAASKVVNGISTSAKVNGIVTKTKFSAKQISSAPVKAQSHVEPKDSTMCNGTLIVKAIPVMVTDIPDEKDLIVLNGKKESEKPGAICNGKAIHSEITNGKLKEDSVVQTNHVNNKVSSIVGSLNSRPKLPPNRPVFLKKPASKASEQKSNEKKAMSKLKLPEKINSKPLESIIKSRCKEENSIESRLTSGSVNDKATMNGDVELLEVVKKVKLPENHQVAKRLLEEENNRKNSEMTTVAETCNRKVPASVPEQKLENGVDEQKVQNKIDEQKMTQNKVDEQNKVQNKVEEQKKIQNKVEEQKKVQNKVMEEKKVHNKALEEPILQNGLKPEISLDKDPMVNGIDIKKDLKTSDAKQTDIKAVKKCPGSSSTSMVFDFRGKDVVSHVAVLPVPFGCKALHPKKRPLLVDGIPNGSGATSDDEDDDYVDYSVPAPCGLVFEGENVKIGKGAILSIRNKDLKITFDDEVDKNTFVYPSESSLIEEPDSRSISPSTEVIPNGHPPSSNKLKTNTSIGQSGAGGLSNYTPSVLRTVDNFHPGMFRPPPAPVLPGEKKEDAKDDNKGEEENTEVSQEGSNGDMLKPADPEVISSWSLSAGTSDLLF